MVGDIGKVESLAKQEYFIARLFEFFFNPMKLIIWVWPFIEINFISYMSEKFQSIHMISHVSSKHHFNDYFSNLPIFTPIKMMQDI